MPVRTRCRADAIPLFGRHVPEQTPQPSQHASLAFPLPRLLRFSAEAMSLRHLRNLRMWFRRRPFLLATLDFRLSRPKGMPPRRFHELSEQRVGAVGAGFELRMELRAEEEWVVGQLDQLDQVVL